MLVNIKKKKKRKLERKDEEREKITKFFKASSSRCGDLPRISVSRSYGSTVVSHGKSVGAADDNGSTLVSQGTNFAAHDIVTDSFEEQNDGTAKIYAKKNDEISESTPTEQNKSSKCKGFKPNISDIFKYTACIPLKKLDIVIENENLHHTSCAETPYVVHNSNVNEWIEEEVNFQKMKHYIQQIMNYFLSNSSVTK